MDKTKRYEVYHSSTTIQLRDNQPDKFRVSSSRGIVAVFPTLGAGYTTWQDSKQALRLARKICKLLNHQ